MAVGDTLPHCTGTGTDTDPYKFSDWDGFLESTTIVNAYVEASIPNLRFDMNELDDALPTTYCRSFDGKGLTIVNLYSDSDRPTHLFQVGCDNFNNPVTFRNLNLYNFVLNHSSTCLLYRTGSFSGSDIYWTFINCNFAGVIVTAVGLTRGSSSNSNPALFRGCSFRVHCNTPGVAAATDSVDCRYKYCTWLLSGTASDLYMRGIFYNCKVMGSIQTTKNSNIVNRSNTDGGWLFLDIDWTGLGLSNNNITEFTNNPILINITKFANATNQPSTPRCLQTTDPTTSDYLYNVDVLNSLNFPIGTVIE